MQLCLIRKHPEHQRFIRPTCCALVSCKTENIVNNIKSSKDAAKKEEIPDEIIKLAQLDPKIANKIMVHHSKGQTWKTATPNQKKEQESIKKQ